MKARLMMVCLIASMSAYAQGYENELKIGDRLPMTELHGMVNYPKQTLRFADHTPKLTILDFWGTTCTVCVVAWPKMLELQKEFGKDVQIILANRHEDEKVVKDFIARRKKLTGVDMNLPVSCKDSTLEAAFPRSAVPRYYWIDSNGVLSSATRGDQVTSANIRKWVTSGPFQMDQIVNEMLWVKGNRPIFVDGNGGSGRGDAFIWSSSLTKGYRNIASDQNAYTKPETGYGLFTTGNTIRDLYSTAYNNRLETGDLLTSMHDSRCIVLAPDTTKYYSRINRVNTATPAYNYQLIAGRPMDRRQLQKLMQEDLDRYFGLSVAWEKRKRRCLVISMSDSVKAQGKSKAYKNYVGETGAYIDGVSVHKVIYFMERGSFFYDPRPIVDETGYKGLLTGIYFDQNCLDIKAFDKGLSKFGMHISEEIREVDILVLREQPASSDQ